MRLLIVEDNEQLQRCYQRFFAKRKGVERVHLVATASDAIAALKEQRFDAVISDYDLDDGSHGLEVWNWIQVNRHPLLERFAFYSGNTKAIGAVSGRVKAFAKPTPFSVVAAWLGLEP